MLQSGITKSVLEVVEQLRESAEHIVAALRDALKQNKIDIWQMTSNSVDNTNTNYGRHHSVFIDVESHVAQLYSHFSSSSSSSKRVANLKEYLQLTFKDINSYRELLFVQIEKYLADHDIKETNNQ
ncbi:unnamed protein product [Rotaria sordida]|uniref:Uncharacterized protein n=1 Tax=Rotaria sordida TaxID=392033 RepID=A0A815ERJ1_9BILA|nr:unnamed protein product [Rotaria sordida]CAF1310041.1 unnamed protein product [Rotaria sordida]CAF1350613.1 unnamed protein product [Rotaria sordida]CAF1387874.1 unnamed protein product [Rotaria sordida]CAF1579844.1 unnamed protein product [Rotaria sordida]